jgi:CPA2 family monovalent cation:H+ antiporter-2/glutathione-regulated potassium-efflux system protein KefB
MLATLVCLLAAAVLFVSLSRRAGFGSILGYLVAGALIGPSGLGLVRDVHDIAEISEFGVLMLLFLIGLELRVQRIWLMRRSVFGLGGAQVIVTGAALAALIHLTGLTWPVSVLVGAGLALSSTAIVLPMLGERDLLASAGGRDAFAVLLFQDLASIPLIAVAPHLTGGDIGAALQWEGLLKAALAVAAILLGGRFLVRPLFRLVGGAKQREVFTATALLCVVGAAAIAAAAGLPLSLGAFAAGVVLAESEYRHELQADIEPFEGILLGFFFISVGMSANTRLALETPGLIAAGVAGLLLVKGVIGFVLGRLKKQTLHTAIRFALALPQGSEFAFVLFGAAMAAGALPQADYQRLTLVVGLSMFASPILFSLSERFLQPRLKGGKPKPFDNLDGTKPAPVVICGFGRFGQVVGRVLDARRITFNALDPDPENVELVRRFGYQAFYGDPTRLDLLRQVGVSEAKLVVVALADVAESLKLVQTLRRAFPDTTILARARNRRHAHLLMDEGVEQIVRETFFSSLRLSELALAELGFNPAEARKTVQAFREHDEQMLVDQHGYYKDEKRVVQTSAEMVEEFHRLFDADRDR